MREHLFNRHLPPLYPSLIYSLGNQMRSSHLRHGPSSPDTMSTFKINLQPDPNRLSYYSIVSYVIFLEHHDLLLYWPAVNNATFLKTLILFWRSVLVNPSTTGRPCPPNLREDKPCPSTPCYTWNKSPWSKCLLQVNMKEYASDQSRILVADLS